MTRRERLERKIEKRGEWAAGRRQKAGALHAYTDRYRGDHAFNTQPGHIPERARVIRMEDRAHEHAEMAAHHDSKAAGLAAQLDRAVFSDDPDAVEALEARIAENEAKRDRMKLVNVLYKKGDAAGLAALGIDLERLKVQLAEAGAWFGKQPHMPYELTNLGARIRGDMERIKVIRARSARSEAAEAAGGVLVEEHGEYAVVMFAEKPDRSVLDALKAAGYFWGNGHWSGKLAALPEAVRATA